jgi:gliding motility-associated-like protein
VNCWDTFVFNTTSCAWDNTGVQAAKPEKVNCWDNFVFNRNTCAWDNMGVRASKPAKVNCWDTFVFNTTSCVWDNTGVQAAKPEKVNCWDNFVFNTTSCAWVNTGVQTSKPTKVNCWDNFVFNTNTCAWENTGVQAVKPTLACYESATFNTKTCNWTVTGIKPVKPILVCYETATFNTATCTWIVTGTRPAKPTTECYETATFNTSSCSWRVTGKPETPIDAPNTVCNSDRQLSIDLKTILPSGTLTNGTWKSINNSAKLKGSFLSPFGLNAGIYSFEYKIENENNCPLIINVKIDDDCNGIVLGCGTILIHNAFSPNGDDKNEVFTIDNIEDTICYPDNTVEIYNRWGVLVYETRNYNNETKAFNGTSQGRTTINRSVDLPTGTYFYILNYTSIDGTGNVQTNKKDGYLYLVR